MVLFKDLKIYKSRKNALPALKKGSFQMKARVQVLEIYL